MTKKSDMETNRRMEEYEKTRNHGTRVANEFFNQKCGYLHLEYMIDKYWNLVADAKIIPSCLLIHKALVKGKYTEKKKFEFNDLDDHVFYCPTKDKTKHKAFVHTTQSRDFLYVLNKDHVYVDDAEGNLVCKDAWKIHIRRLWRVWDAKRHWLTPDDVLKNMNSVLAHLDALEEFADDHAQHSHRPSLNFYKKINFEIPRETKKGQKEMHVYGDLRDRGFIMSSEYQGIRGCKYSINTIELINNCFLPSIACALDIDVPAVME